MPLPVILLLLLQLPLDEGLLHDLLGEDGHLLGGGHPGLRGPGRDGEVGGAGTRGEHQGRDSSGRGLGRKRKTGHRHGRGQPSLSLHRDQLQHGEQHVTLSLLPSENRNENMYIKISRLTLHLEGGVADLLDQVLHSDGAGLEA